MKRTLILILLIGAMAGTAFAERVTPIIDNGAPAPIFMLPSLDGQRVSLRDFCGKLRNPWKNKTKYNVVVSFMASYCVPCRHEIPQLEAFAKQAPEDVKVIFISIDTLGKRVLMPFREKMKITLPILMDRYGNVMKKYGVKKLPSLFIIDKNGKMRFQSLNGLPPDLDLKEALNKKIALISGNKQSATNNDAARQMVSVPVQKKIDVVAALLEGKPKEAVSRESKLSIKEIEDIRQDALKTLKTQWTAK